MSLHIGLLNRRLQPLGHLSERCNPYAFGVSGSNQGSESAESAESRHERGGPKSGPTPAPGHALERTGEGVRGGVPLALAGDRDGAKSGAMVVPEVVTFASCPYPCCSVLGMCCACCWERGGR